jgi:hypothetical protein
MKIGLMLDSISRDRVLGNALVQAFNEHFDELVLEYVTAYVGPKDRTILDVCIGLPAKTETNQVGIHNDRLVYGFKIKNIVVCSTLLIETNTAVLPVAVKRSLNGKVRDATKITRWFFIPTIELTGTLMKI